MQTLSSRETDAYPLAETGIGSRLPVAAGTPAD